MRLRTFVYGFLLCLALASVCSAQDTPSDPSAAPAAAAPLSQPAITGPLSGLPPANFEAGPLGKISVNGILAGGGMGQRNPAPSANTTQAPLTHGQVCTHTADGPLPF